MKLDRRSVLKQLGAGVAASSLLAPLRASAAASNATMHATPDPDVPAARVAPIRLDRNENAYGPSKKAIAAVHESANQISRYPDGKGPFCSR